MNSECTGIGGVVWLILQGREVRGAAFAAACALVVATQSKDTFYEAPLKWAGTPFRPEREIVIIWKIIGAPVKPQSVELSATKADVAVGLPPTSHPPIPVFKDV